MKDDTTQLPGPGYVSAGTIPSWMPDDAAPSAPPSTDAAGEAAHVKEARRICRDGADSATHQLNRQERQWKPARADYEGLRNRLRNAERELDAALAKPSPSPVAAGGAMTVIDPDQWEPCSPVYLKAGGSCDAPRVWNEQSKNHWHPKIATPTAPNDDLRAALEDLTRPLLGIENRTPHEVRDILFDRIRRKFAALGERKA